MTGLRVLIAEDNEELRELVVALLNSEFTIVGSVGDGEGLVQAAVLREPDIIVSDINIPLKDAFAARDAIRKKGIECPFVFMTMMDISSVRILTEDEPVGYVHKKDLFHELKLAILTVIVGRSYTSRSFGGTPDQ